MENMPVQDSIGNTTSIYKLCREIKQQEHTLFNCLNSIVEDAAFCNEIRVLYPNLPLLANLRCGLWYAPDPDGTCYFKSTDGHSGHHQFSTTRLNWHVAEIAARKGGCIIVDATRRGKIAPDAMSKTIPIWAAVLNRAVARVRLHDAQKEERRRLYATHNGDVFMAVTDTQTSISVRSEEQASTSCSYSGFAPGEVAASTAAGQLHVADSQNSGKREAAAQQARSPCSTGTVEELLVDCMGDGCMELLSGLTVNVPKSSSRSNQPSASIAHSDCVSSVTKPGAKVSTIGSPIGRPSMLQRSLSLQISPQPSLQEWLDEADMMHRLSAALHHMDCCRSPVRRARLSCHSIIGNGSIEINNMVAVAEHEPVLYASSAPASCCVFGSPAPSSSSFTSSKLQNDAAAVLDMQRKQHEDHCATLNPEGNVSRTCSQPEQGSLTLLGGRTADPATPRLGSSRTLASQSAAFSSIQQALQDEAQSLTVASTASDLAAQHLQLLEQQREPLWGLSNSPAGGDAVSIRAGDMEGDSQADAAHDFAFPPPYLLAQSAGSSMGEAVGLVAAGPGSSDSSSSCVVSAPVLPEMPVVVLNGTSHQPGDAASILHIWRSTDLEDVATLPGISDFRPGVYHFPEEMQDLDDEDNAGCDCSQSQRRPNRCDQPVQDSSRDGWVIVSGQQSNPILPQAAACAARSSQRDSCCMDEETGLGFDGLCVLAPPAAALPAAADDSGSSACSVGSAACIRPSSPSACSSCSADSSISNGSGHSRRSATTTSSNQQEDVGAESWDTELHLPLWVPAHERQAIEAKLDGWVERLLEVGADVRGLAAQLQKPLRPLWVTQESLIWTNQVAQPDTLPFTPLLLVSASHPRRCERQAARALSSFSAAGGSCSASGLSGVDDLSDDELPSASTSTSKAAAQLSRSCIRSANGAHQHQDHQQAHLSRWSYVYVPGAGDDEESWAAGLTPHMFWDNCAALLACGPEGIAAAVKRLAMQQKNIMRSSSAGGIGSGFLSGRRHSPLQPLQSERSNGRRSNGSPPRVSVLTDEHHLAPKGCVGLSEVAAAAGFKVVKAAPGSYWLGNTSLALGNLEGATAADVWRTFDAVLCCGTALSPVLQPEHHAVQLSQVSTPAVLCSPALCSSAPTNQVDAHMNLAARSHCSATTATASLLSHQTYSWHGDTHRLEPVSSSFSGCCSDWQAQQQKQKQQQQLQQTAVTSAITSREAAADNENLQINKLDVPSAATKQVRRKSGMLSELLSKSKQQQCTLSRVRGSADQVGSTAACAVSTGAPCSTSHMLGAVNGSFDLPAAQLCGSAYLPRLKWLPIEGAKRDRFSLKQYLQEALEFVSAHLAAGHLVLLHDLEGHDNCVCVAVATLLACFSPPVAAGTEAAAEGGKPAAAQSQPSFVAPWPTNTQLPCNTCGDQPLHLPPEPVTKQTVRQRLALVSSCYPVARPTRGSLKQVFNFFEECRRAASASPQRN